MKAKTITLDNLPQQKMSDIFESVLYDLDKLPKFKIKINMMHYLVVNGTCTVCLGGAAVCGFFPDLNKGVLEDIQREVFGSSFEDKTGKVNGYKLTQKQDRNLIYMAQMFNSFRADSIYNTFTHYNSFSKNKRVFSGDKIQRVRDKWMMDTDNLLYATNIDKIKEAIKKFVAILREEGL